MKILVAKGNSAYGALREYTDMIINELKKNGHKVICVDRQKAGEWESIVDIVDESFDMVLSCQILAFKAKVMLEKSGKVYPNIKYVSLCGDHPLYENYWLKSMRNCDNAYWVTADENQYKFLKKYCPQINSKLIRQVIGNAIGEKKFSEREFEVYFGGSYFDVNEEMRKIENEEPQLCLDSKKVIDRILKNSGMTLEKALEDILEETGRCLLGEEFLAYIEKFTSVDRYIRGVYRNRFLEAAIKSGRIVTVCGNGWEKSHFINYENFNYLGSTNNMYEAFEYMSNSKVIINIMPWSYIGFHDRIPNILKVGAVCITNTNTVVKEVFKDGVELKGIELDKENEITEYILWLFNNLDEAEKIAKNGKNAGEKYFNMSNFYKELQDLFE